MYISILQRSTRDRMFAECLERRQVQGALVELFRRRGYTEVITPEVEFYDLFVQSGTPIPQESMLKIIDRSGKIMVMRPDCTPAHCPGGGDQAEGSTPASAAVL